MLSRVADSLFWLSRNVERAETIARLLDVTASHAVVLEESLDVRTARLWEPTLRAVGFTGASPAAGPRDAFLWSAFDSTNPSSLVSCVRVARANAIGIRAFLSTEAWLALNTLYLYVEDQRSAKVMRSGPSRFLRRVRDAAQGFAGVCDATLMHADAWNYLQIGRFLERAYMTSRMLASIDVEGEAWPEAQRLLDMCCASEPFMQAIAHTPETADAIAFVIGSTEFPRSIRFCAREMDAALRRISRSPAGTYANEAERVVARLRARLDFTPVDELIADGLRPWAEALRSSIERIAIVVQESYTPALTLTF